MGLIYIAKNTVNGNSYIGKVVRTFDERRNRHFKDAKNPKYINNRFYRAINKYEKKYGIGIFYMMIYQKNILDKWKNFIFFYSKH